MTQTTTYVIKLNGRLPAALANELETFEQEVSNNLRLRMLQDYALQDTYLSLNMGEVEPYYAPGHTLPRIFYATTTPQIERPALIDMVFGGGVPAVDRNYTEFEIVSPELELPDPTYWEALNPPITQQRRRRNG